MTARRDITQYQDELGSFDFMLMIDVLEHAHHPLNVLREVCEHLKPGGRMLLKDAGLQVIAFPWRAETAKMLSGVLELLLQRTINLQIAAIGDSFRTQMQFMPRKTRLTSDIP